MLISTLGRYRSLSRYPSRPTADADRLVASFGMCFSQTMRCIEYSVSASSLCRLLSSHCEKKQSRIALGRASFAYTQAFVLQIGFFQPLDERTSAAAMLTALAQFGIGVVVVQEFLGQLYRRVVVDLVVFEQRAVAEWSILAGRGTRGVAVQTQDFLFVR